MRDGPWSIDHSKSWQLKIFKMAAVAAIVDIITKWFSNSESLWILATILDSGMKQIQQFWISVSLWCLPSSFGSIRLLVWEEMSIEEFQDGCHGGQLGHQNGMILAILNLYVASMPPITFQLNLTYDLGDVVRRISRWPLWRRPSWILEWNSFSNSESLCRSDASHPVSAQSALWFGRRFCLKNFKMEAVASILNIRTERLYLFWISLSLWCLPSSFCSIWLKIWKEMWFE